MTDTTDMPETPHVLSPRDEARVRFALRAEMISREALDLLPIDPDAPRGERLRQVLDLKAHLDTLIGHAVIAEREEGTTWSQLADAAGVTKQAAHERWAGTVSAWAASGRTAYGRGGRYSALDAARRLDQVYADCHPGHPQRVVSSGLDAVRFPGAVAAEAARRERAKGLHARLKPLQDRILSLNEEWNLLTAGAARPKARAAVLIRQAETYQEMADLYEELTGAEPELADEHRTNAESSCAAVLSSREYAELLLAKTEECT
ncbi:hypothetical protein ACF053_29595 [Streptomyces kanasensis]|uniref:hypothetical protein n=1 Tax=Streptomyces kanasensis TaxID=936756 RepID=UPI0036FD4DF0